MFLRVTFFRARVNARLTNRCPFASTEANDGEYPVYFFLMSHSVVFVSTGLLVKIKHTRSCTHIT